MRTTSTEENTKSKILTVSFQGSQKIVPPITGLNDARVWIWTAPLYLSCLACMEPGKWLDDDDDGDYTSKIFVFYVFCLRVSVCLMRPEEGTRLRANPNGSCPVTYGYIVEQSDTVVGNWVFFPLCPWCSPRALCFQSERPAIRSHCTPGLYHSPVLFRLQKIFNLFLLQDDRSPLNATTSHLVCRGFSA